VDDKVSAQQADLIKRAMDMGVSLEGMTVQVG
jgi:hypothetical protein